MPTNERELEQSAAPSRPVHRAAALAANILIIAVSLVLSLFVAEAGFRIAKGVPLLEASNWRLDGVRTKRIGDRAALDPALGWTLKANYRSDGFNTSGYGIRRNGDETDIRTGGILAVGDSFTEGFEEVADDETWPAHLEKILGIPVINGGVSGYAVDQIILRAEQLVPLVDPKVLIIGFTEVDIYRAALSEAGAPKPYFTVEDDALVQHPPGPFEPARNESLPGAALRGVLGYSALSDYLLSRLAPGFWYPTVAATYQEVDNRPLDIACRLLERLKRLTDEKVIRLMLFLQYNGELVLEEPDIVDDMRFIGNCAQGLQIQVVDQFAPLKALTRGYPDLVADYYGIEGGEFGHMTSKGNEHAAQLLAGALGKDQAPVSAKLGEREPSPN